MKRKIFLIPAAFFLIVAQSAAALSPDSKISRSPWLLYDHRSRILVCSSADDELKRSLNFQEKSGGENFTIVGKNAETDCLTANNAAPGKKYNYQLSAGAGESFSGFFRAPPKIFEPFRFVVYGDTRNIGEVHQQVVKLIDEQLDPEFIIHTGDWVDHGGIRGQWNQYFNLSAKLTSNRPIIPVVGNHDDRLGSHYDEYFPVGSDDGDVRYYELELFGSLFLVLDSENDLSPGSAQHSWLKEKLAAGNISGKKYIFVSFHRSPYSSGGHSGQNDNLRKSLSPLFEEAGVSVVFNGHDHNYERSFRNGVYYIVAGGGGAPYWHRDKPDHIPHPKGNQYRQLFSGAAGAVAVDVGVENLRLRYYDTSGKVLDELTVDRRQNPGGK